MKLYVIEYSSGSYEDYEFHIEGIFTNPHQAELSAEKIRKQIEEWKDTECPTGEKSPMELEENEWQLYYSWMDLQNKAREFNFWRVTEYESDSIWNPTVS